MAGGLISTLNFKSRRALQEEMEMLKLKAVPEKGTTWLKLEMVFSPSLKVSGLAAS